MKKSIHINDLEEGMVLAEAVKNKFNQVLCPANIVTEAKHIKLFKTWGIQSLTVFELIINQDTEGSETAMPKQETNQQEFLFYLGWEPRNSFELDLFEMAKHRYRDLDIEVN